MGICEHAAYAFATLHRVIIWDLKKLQTANSFQIGYRRSSAHKSERGRAPHEFEAPLRRYDSAHVEVLGRQMGQRSSFYHESQLSRIISRSLLIKGVLTIEGCCRGEGDERRGIEIKIVVVI